MTDCERDSQPLSTLDCRLILPKIPFCGGETGAAVSALVISVAGQATPSSSAHLPVPEQPGVALQYQVQHQDHRHQPQLGHRQGCRQWLYI